MSSASMTRPGDRWSPLRHISHPNGTMFLQILQHANVCSFVDPASINHICMICVDIIAWMDHAGSMENLKFLVACCTKTPLVAPFPVGLIFFKLPLATCHWRGRGATCSTIVTHLGVSKNHGTPKSQIIHFNRVFHYKPSILGYHYFWKQPLLSHLVYSNLVLPGMVIAKHHRENVAIIAPSIS